MTNTPLAFLQRGFGDVVIGYGPFTERSTPPEDGLAFYRNDFWLTDPKPWKVPARVERVEDLAWLTQGGPATRVRVSWEVAQPTRYAAVFREAMTLLKSGSLRKTVPVVTRHGRMEEGCTRDLLAPLSFLPAKLHAYGWLGADRQFLGATPETLVQGHGQFARTMALAGTARPAEVHRLAHDPKEVLEHDLVVEALQQRLATLGPVYTGPRSTLDLGTMAHLHTPITVGPMAANTPGLAGLIELLHPTPALGSSPRTPATMALLREWRERLDCPGVFGAPFGVWDHGRLDVLVAIRMLAVEGKSVLLPSGGGLVAQSSLQAEWDELHLKAHSVHRLFGLPKADRRATPTQPAVTTAAPPA